MEIKGKRKNLRNLRERIEEVRETELKYRSKSERKNDII
jgi:hypothetical protein